MPIHASERVRSLLLRTARSSARANEVAVWAQDGAPSGASTPFGDSLETGQAAIVYQNDAAVLDDLVWVTIDAGTTWTRLATMTSLVLDSAVDATIAAGVLTVTQAVHTMRGEGGAADNLDNFTGGTDAEIMWMICGAEAITIRDAAVGAGNIALHGDTSLILAIGDVVKVVLSGSTYSVVPVSMAAGIPAGAVALARGSVIAGNASAQGSAVDISTADTVAIGDGTDVATMVLPTTGLVAKTAAGAAAGRTLTVAAGSATAIAVADGDGQAGNPTVSVQAVLEDLATLGAVGADGELLVGTGVGVFAWESGPTVRTSLGLGTGDSPQFAGLRLTGALLIDGGAFLGDVEQIDINANYLVQNTDYVTAVAVTGGRAVNYLPTATADTTVGAGVVTAGVDGVSDPTITTFGAAVFADTDIVQISGSANNGENDGWYEVLSHAANLLTLRSTSNGISNRAEDFTLDQVTANAGDTGMAITKIGVAVDRCGTDGRFEAGFSNQTGITYSDYLLASDIGTTVQAEDATLTSIAALGTVADRILYTTALDTWAESAITAAGRAILDDADASAQRTTLGVDVYDDQNVLATIAVADAGGGGTTSLMTVDLLQSRDGVTAIGSARQVMIRCAPTQYQPEQPAEASVTFGTVTAGAIIASGGGWCLAQTDATGNFDCTVTNTDDDTLYFHVETARQGVSVVAERTTVVGSNSDSATWSA